MQDSGDGFDPNMLTERENPRTLLPCGTDFKQYPRALYRHRSEEHDHFVTPSNLLPNSLRNVITPVDITVIAKCNGTR